MSMLCVSVIGVFKTCSTNLAKLKTLTELGSRNWTRCFENEFRSYLFSTWPGVPCLFFPKCTLSFNNHVY